MAAQKFSLGDNRPEPLLVGTTTFSRNRSRHLSWNHLDQFLGLTQKSDPRCTPNPQGGCSRIFPEVYNPLLCLTLLLSRLKVKALRR